MTPSIAHSGHESEAPNVAATSTNDIVAIIASSGKRCFFVDETYHRPSICLAVEVACYSSKKCGDALDAVELLKRELRGSSLQSIDKSLPFVSECDTTDVAISATLNQDGRPVPFMS